MKIRYNPAVDLCCALLQYAHWDEFAVNIPGYRVSSELEKWYRTAKSNLPGLLDNDIRYLVTNFLGLLFLPVETALQNEINSPAELIKTFKELPSAGLPERLFNSYKTDIDFNSVKDEPEKIINAIQKAGGTTRANEPEFFLDFYHRPDVIRQRLVIIMEDFYSAAIAPYEKAVLDLMKKELSEEQLLFEQDPAAFYSEVFHINYSEDDAGQEIYISYYDETDIIQLDNPQAIVYGRRRKDLVREFSLPLDQIYSLLADESRRTILRMLCRKPWFIRELADELDLTSATVSYHMSKLSNLNLVGYQRGERKRIYYSADRDEVSRMLKTVESDILG